MVIINKIDEVFQNFAKNSSIVLRDNKCVLKFLTFDDVKELADRILDWLIKCNVVKGTCVGLLMQHNVYLPPVIVSLLKHQCPFFFINSSMRNDKNWDAISRSNIKWILSFDQCSNGLLKKFTQDSNLNLKNSDELKLWKTSHVEKIYKNICYIIQTSGTTGDEKIVRVENYCIESNVENLQNIFQLTSKDIIYFGTPLHFDPSIVELFLGLITGACLLIVPTRVRINPTQLLSALFSKKLPIENRTENGEVCKTSNQCFDVTFLQMPPSLFLRWSERNISHILQDTDLRILALGGEKFPNSILPMNKKRTLRLFNLYGITEVSCWASVFEIKDVHGEETNQNIPLGKSLKDTILEVRNNSCLQITDGIGEIYIGSSSRICYLDNEDELSLTKPMFRATGDLAEVINNIVYYKGRKVNESIKRFGHRISLNSIEEIVYNETKLLNSVIWIENSSKLVVFVIVNEFDTNTKSKIEDKLRIKLLNVLPKENFPDHILILPKFPLTSNGKINKAALENTFRSTTDDRTRGEDPIEVFKNLWNIYFGLSQEEFYDLTFMQLGGNSILALQFLSEFKDLIDVEFSSELVNFVFEKTYAECCEHVRANFKIHQKKCDSQSQINKRKTDDSEEKFIDCDFQFEIKWKYNLKACVDASASIFNYSGRPLVAIGAFSSEFAVLDLETGELVSTRIFPDSVENTSTFAENNLFIGCRNGSLYCLSVNNCCVLWEFKTGDVIKNKPCLCLKNTAVVFGSYDKFVYCLDIQNGKELWKTFAEGCITSSPVCEENFGFIFIASLVGLCICLSEIDGKVIWKYDCRAPVFGSPCFIESCDEKLIIWPDVQGSLHCLSCKYGRQLWTKETSRQTFSSVINHDNHIFCTSKDGYLSCFDCTNSICLKKYEISLMNPSTMDVHFVRMDSEMYIVASTNSGNMFIIHYNSGKIVGKFKLPAEVFSSPTGIDNRVIIGCRDNNVYCLKIQNVPTSKQLKVT